MERALQSAALTPAAISYVNAHGTATPFNDATEGKAITELFGRVPVSSTKGMMGHSLGAAGAIEAVFTIIALRNRFLPANINFRVSDIGTRSRYRRERGPLRRPRRRALQFFWLWRNERFDRAAGARGMSLRVAGLGWVTPLGATIEEVWEKLCSGAAAEPTTLGESLGEKNFQAYQVPTAALAEVARHPRLRRSSAISRFAVLAGLRALRDAGLELDEASAARTALIFAISNGGVIYTSRFYHEIVKSGAAAASPLLVSRDGFQRTRQSSCCHPRNYRRSYTLVGDGAVGILALKMAEELMTNGDLDRCLVVGAEEADWLLCDAYRRWRLLRAAPPIEPFARLPRGMILSEGAGAVVLAREGKLTLDRIHPGGNFAHRRRTRPGNSTRLLAICKRDIRTDLLIASANGTFIDASRGGSGQKSFPGSGGLHSETGAGRKRRGERALAVDLRRPSAPDAAVTSAPARSGGFSPNDGTKSRSEKAGSRAVVTTCGLNQQVAALALQLVDLFRPTG